MNNIASLFPNLTEPDLIEEIESVGKFVEFKEGEDIISTGAYIKRIPLLTDVAIRVLRDDGVGNEVFLYFVD